jgi:hypothetical protein
MSFLSSRRSTVSAAVIAVGLLIGSIAAAAPASAATGTRNPSQNAESSYCKAHLATWQQDYGTWPNKPMWCETQWLAAQYTYTGIIDGEMGTNSWKGVQEFLKAHYHYDGPVDGVPGKNTYLAMQRYAADWGYKGAQDGVMGTNSWKAWATGVSSPWWD